MRRRLPAILIACGLLALLVSYVFYTRRLVRELRQDAKVSSQMYARVYQGLNDTSDVSGTSALLDISGHIVALGIPVILTDSHGKPTAAANLPFHSPLDSPRTRAYVAELDKQNAPVEEQGVGTVHFGDAPLVTGLRIIPIIQLAMLLLLLAAGFYIFRVRGRAEREQVWAGMARESAHQLGTPLSSLAGWIELLEENTDPTARTAVAHMRTDLERLGRVAHRFERIGRPPRQDSIDLGEIAERVTAYFRARVPTLANAVTVTCTREGSPLTVKGDAVLIEWALEALVKNAIDALAGRGGHLDVTVTALPESHVRVRVSDDGPGIPREMRTRIFEAGFSTKSSGWGIGLSLARRIIGENHGGTLALVPSERGATFDVILG